MSSQLLHHVAEGAGPPVALLHPVGLDLTFWQPVVAALATRFTVHVVDLRGHGMSPPAPRSHRLPDFADDIARTLVTKVGMPLTLIGLSFGGMLSQIVALRHPGIVDRLVLCGCPCTFPDEARPQIADRGRAAERGGMRAVVDTTLQRWFSSSFLASGGAAAVRRRLLSDSVDGWATAWRAISELDTGDELAGLQRPTLCLAGEFDEAVPPEMVAAMAKRIARAEYSVLPAASHMMHIENTAAFTERISAFLNER